MKMNLCLSSVISSLLTGVNNSSAASCTEAVLSFINCKSPLSVPLFLSAKLPVALATLYYVFNLSSAISTFFTLCPRSLISTDLETIAQSTSACSSMF